MNPEDQKLLEELKIFCSPEIVAKYNYKQENQNDWTRFYYYKDRRRQVVTNANVDYDYEVSSTLTTTNELSTKSRQCRCKTAILTIISS